MLNTDFFYPTMNIQVGPYSLNAGVLFDVHSSKESSFDWAKIRFTDKVAEALTINKMDPVKIELGYSGENEVIFDGYVKRTLNSGNTSSDEIVAKDEMIKLEETTITETFLNVSPQELIKFSLDKAGISKYKLSQETFAKKPAIPVAKKSAIRLIDEVHKIWGIQKHFFFSDEKTFYWGEKPQQTKVYEFVYGENIISMAFQDGFWIIDTISAPFIKHSHNIMVEHPRVSGTFEVYRVNFSVNESGFPRTRIFFKTEG